MNLPASIQNHLQNRRCSLLISPRSKDGILYWLADLTDRYQPGMGVSPDAALADLDRLLSPNSAIRDPKSS